MTVENRTLDQRLKTYALRSLGKVGHQDVLQPIDVAFTLEDIQRARRIKYINHSSNHTFYPLDHTAYFGKINVPEIQAGSNNAFFGNIQTEKIEADGDVTVYGVRSDNDLVLHTDGKLLGGNLHANKHQSLGATANKVELYGPVRAGHGLLGGVQRIADKAEGATVRLQGVFRAAKSQFIANRADNATVDMIGVFRPGPRKRQYIADRADGATVNLYEAILDADERVIANQAEDITLNLPEVYNPGKTRCTRTYVDIIKQMRKDGDL